MVNSQTQSIKNYTGKIIQIAEPDSQQEEGATFTYSIISILQLDLKTLYLDNFTVYISTICFQAFFILIS